MVQYNKKLIPRAIDLRKNMTKQERKLWYEFLRKYPEKVYKQKVIDHFILDFYCHKAMLAIEIDGSQHYSEEGLAHDEERSNILRGYGIKFIRFSNLDIDRNFEAVCCAIDVKIKEALSTM